MSDYRSISPPEANPLTQRAHRREVLLQITIPLIIALAVILFLSVLATIGPDDVVSRWGDTSLIWLIIPQLFVCLLFLVLLAGLTFGVVWLIRTLPGYARQVQDFFNLVGMRTRSITNAIVEPVLRVHSFVAKIKAFRDSKGLRR